MLYDSFRWGWHFKGVLREAVKLAGLQKHGSVLDFGCEQQTLKRFLPEDVVYHGYDMLPAYSPVKDYRALKGIDVVFALNVLEHFVGRKELRAALKNFRKIGAKKVVVALPNENSVFNRFLRFVSGYDALNFFHHPIAMRAVVQELSREFGPPVVCKRFHLVQFLAVYELGRQ